MTMGADILFARAAKAPVKPEVINDFVRFHKFGEVLAKLGLRTKDFTETKNESTGSTCTPVHKPLILSKIDSAGYPTHFEIHSFSVNKVECTVTVYRGDNNKVLKGYPKRISITTMDSYELYAPWDPKVDWKILKS